MKSFFGNIKDTCILDENGRVLTSWSDQRIQKKGQFAGRQPMKKDVDNLMDIDDNNLLVISVLVALLKAVENLLEHLNHHASAKEVGSIERSEQRWPTKMNGW